MRDLQRALLFLTWRTRYGPSNLGNNLGMGGALSIPFCQCLFGGQGDVVVPQFCLSRLTGVLEHVGRSLAS